MDEFAIIKDFVERSKKQKQNNEANEKMLMHMAMSRLKAKAERANKLIDLANLLLTNGISLGIKECDGRSYPFTTDGISHKLGFVVSGNPYYSVALCGSALGIGCNGYGSSDSTIYIGKNGSMHCSGDWSHYSSSTQSLNYINDGFDAFEERFLAYVRSFESRNS